jgi:D-galactarolactone cycloisomerase
LCQGRPLLRITSVETIHVRRTLSRPTGPAGAFNAARQSLLIKISTDAGLDGWGETYALAGVRAAIDTVLAPLLIGRNPLDLRRLWQAQWDATFGNGFAVGGTDIALHDLCGKALGVPVHQLYGGAQRAQVPVYASGMCYFPDVDPASYWVDEACALVQRGYRAIKMRIGRYPPEHELPLVARVRESLPPHVKLMVDAWGSYTPPTALRVGRELERLGVYWYEEPLPQAGYAGYAELCSGLEIAVAGGETLQSRPAFKELIDARAVDIVQPDVSICGGIGEVLFVADLARLSGIQCAPHSWNGQIMNAATLHIAALLPEPTRMPGNDLPMLEFDTTENPFMAEELVQPLELREGCFEVPTLPGLGIEVDEARVRACAVDA